MTIQTEQTASNGQIIAQTIIQQLGGTNRLSAMLNAKNFTHDQSGKLTFQFSGCKKYNYIEISLNSLDLYDLSFCKFKNGRMDFKKGIYHEPEYKQIKTFNSIYNDMLKPIIERETSLYLSL
jgi:hypothetical protein